MYVCMYKPDLKPVCMSVVAAAKGKKQKEV